MPSPIEDLELACPSGGKFYICDKAKFQFLGCCTSDPCTDGSGNCPQGNLRTSTFRKDKNTYDRIQPQLCAAPYSGATYWFTCLNEGLSVQPFLGCCKTPPCSSGGCPQDSLVAARLHDDSYKRAMFLSPTATSGSAKPSSTTSSTTTSTGPTTTAAASAPAVTPGQESTANHGQLSTGAIIGISVGVAAVVLVAVGFLLYKCGWRQRGRREEERHVMPMPSAVGSEPYQPYQGKLESPYKDSFASSPTAVNFSHSPYSDQRELTPHRPPSSIAGSPGMSWVGTDSGRVSYASSAATHGWAGGGGPQSWHLSGVPETAAARYSYDPAELPATRPTEPAVELPASETGMSYHSRGPNR